MAAKFYFGQNTLTEQFTLPFNSCKPKAMTLDKSLGTVVIGATDDNTPGIVYSAHPYTTGTAMVDGFPTGVTITALKWI